MLSKLKNSFQTIKFFNKVFLAYAFIIIVALFALARIISANITSSSLERDIRYNQLVLNNIDSLFEQKEKVVLLLAKQAYSNTSLERRVFEFLEYDSNVPTQKYYEMRQRFISYLESAFAYDRDLTATTIYNMSDNICYLVSKKGMVNYDASAYMYPEMLEQINDYSPRAVIYPAHLPSYREKEFVYTIAMNIKSISTFNNTGTLMADFDADGITRAVIRQYDEITGDILVLGGDGKVIYDSSGSLYGSSYPYFDLLKPGTSTARIAGEDCIVNVHINKNLNILIAGIIQKNKALEKIENTKKNVFMISFLCILAVLLFTFLITKVFSSRIKLILTAMNKVRSGNLTTRIQPGSSHDELYEISKNFNKMCCDLEIYIDKVYISEIKQKHAELMALQAQVNPHFLHNTLEAIRMKANTSGAKEAGEMIFILSRLFRNAVKENTITNISEEIESSMLYLQLFKIRYGSRLSVVFDIDRDIDEYGIIRHIIQPIIENYIVHGFDSSLDNNKVSIKGYKDGECIYIQVEDNGKGIEDSRLTDIRKSLEQGDLKNTGSIGLANVNERIKIIFGPRCGLELTSNERKGTIVRIKILVKTVKELRDYVQNTNR